MTSRSAGGISISSARLFDEPRLIIKDGAEIGWNAVIVVNCETVNDLLALIKPLSAVS